MNERQDKRKKQEVKGAETEKDERERVDKEGVRRSIIGSEGTEVLSRLRRRTFLHLVVLLRTM